MKTGFWVLPLMVAGVLMTGSTQAAASSICDQYFGLLQSQAEEDGILAEAEIKKLLQDRHEQLGKVAEEDRDSHCSAGIEELGGLVPNNGDFTEPEEDRKPSIPRR